MWAYIYTYGKNEVCNPSKLSELLESGRGGIKNGKMGCLPLVCSQFNGFEVNPTLLAATSSRTLRNDAASSESTDPEGQQSSTPPLFITISYHEMTRRRCLSYIKNLDTFHSPKQSSARLG